MWVPKAVADWFQISKESVDALREELSATKAERDIFKHQLTVAQTNFDWLRIKVNQLEFEKTALMQKVYNIHFPAPEITRQSPVDPEVFAQKDLTFEDIGEEMARKLGLPIYADK